MHTLPHHVEFLSSRWVEEARSFLAGEVPKVRERPIPAERLKGRSFAVSGRLTEAPPHLEAAGDVVCCTVRFDGEVFSLGPLFDPSADLVVEGDYQAALTGAQMVGIAAPAAVMIYRNPPRLGEMLGEDDWFEKTTAAGRDYERFNYMRQLLAFNDAGKRQILAEAAAPAPLALAGR